MADGTLFKSEIEKARTRLKSLFGNETFIRFREDLRDLYIEHGDTGDVSEWDKRRWTKVGRTGLDESRQKYLKFETGLDLINLSDALLSAIVGLAVNWVAKTIGIPSLPSILLAFGVTLFIYSLNTGLVFTKALVSEIAYPPEMIHTRLDPSDLRFRAGWNKGVLQSSGSLAGIILYGTLTHPDSRGYKLGLSIAEWWLKNR